MIRFVLNAKIFFLFKIVLLYSILSLKSYSDNLEKNKDFVALGSDAAIVKIKVFSSLTCPHCANFHMKIIPEIKKEYIDKGKVQIIFIDFPLDQAAFNASKILHCLDKKKQVTFLDILYETQVKWTNGSDINELYYSALDSMIVSLKENNIALIQVHGHASSTASEDYNMKLSIKRKDRVVNYLIKNGIDKARIS